LWGLQARVFAALPTLEGNPTPELVAQIGVVSGHDFSRAEKCHKKEGFTGCEKLAVLKGHDFSRAVNAAKSKGPLGPEGCFSRGADKNQPFFRSPFSPWGHSSLAKVHSCSHF
jgi:hypothetical protein